MATANGHPKEAAAGVPDVPETPRPTPAARRIRDPVKAAAAFRKDAQHCAHEALQVLAWLAKNATSEAVRVSAANALLDRAYGRPAQAAKPSVEADPGDARKVHWTLQWIDPRHGQQSSPRPDSSPNL